MEMKRKRQKTAARTRAAVLLLLLLGCLLPGRLPHGKMEIPEPIERLLTQTLAEEEIPERIAFVRTACALTGQVPYFWGGKSRAIGWDGAWGWPRRVKAEGSNTTGRLCPYGLDCSGLVSWAAATALGDPAAYDRAGEGVRAQYGRCTPVITPRPGDLAFFPDLSHVGIVVGRDEMGTLWVVHCSRSREGVVVTPAAVGFSTFGRPEFFSDNA